MLFRSVVIDVKKGNVTTNLHQHWDQSASSKSSSKFSEHCSFVDFLVVFDKATLYAFVVRKKCADKEYWIPCESTDKTLKVC